MHRADEHLCGNGRMTAARARHIPVIGVGGPVGSGKTALVQEFVQRRGLPYSVALDVQGKLTSAFGGVPYVPAAFLIAPNGNIVLNSTGRLDTDKARRIIAKYLKGTAS